MKPWQSRVILSLVTEKHVFGCVTEFCRVYLALIELSTPQSVIKTSVIAEIFTLMTPVPFWGMSELLLLAFKVSDHWLPIGPVAFTVQFRLHTSFCARKPLQLAFWNPVTL